MNEPLIENGFAKVGPGTWLVHASQPVAILGHAAFFGLKGWLVPDRSRLRLVKIDQKAFCADAARPFLTQIPCAAPLTVVTAKFLLSPQNARKGGSVMRTIPFSFRHSICTTECTQEWVVMATKSRVTSVTLQEGETLTVHVDSAVAWTTKRPTGFCPRITLRDVLLPKLQPNRLMLDFFGPGIVWMEGANAS